jgi:hypothetical protein
MYRLVGSDENQTDEPSENGRVLDGLAHVGDFIGQILSSSVYRRIGRAIGQATWQGLADAGRELKLLYIRYDGNTTESCVREITGSRALIIASMISLGFYISQIIIVIYYMYIKGYFPLPKDSIMSTYKFYLYPSLIPIMVFYPTLKVVYRRLKQRTICFSCHIPFGLMYVRKQEVLDTSRTSEVLQSADIVSIRSSRRPILSPPQKHAICFHCGTRFSIFC